MRYLLGLLNSKLLNYWYGRRYKTITQSINSYQKVPIHIASPSEQEPVIRLVERMLSLNRQLAGMDGARNTEGARILEEIARTDARIDDAVYALYGINEEERKVIEASFRAK